VPTLGLYRHFLACKAMVLRSSLQPRLTVVTMFCSVGTIPSTAVMCCFSSDRGPDAAGCGGSCWRCRRPCGAV
ncbi:hypothetical protein BKA70DRAFT_1134401, partial [Coprinopsis sp. MPI-PUGE-AT-0042]